VEADATRCIKSRRSGSGKTVTWGDLKEPGVDGPCEAHRYGGWGLNAFFIIPNREQLREMTMSMAERQVESDDLDDYSFMEENSEVDFLHNHFSIFADDEKNDDEEDFNIDDDKTIFPADEEKDEAEQSEDEDDTDPDSPDSNLDQSMVPQSDSDEETPVECGASCRKRVKLEPQNETNSVCFEDVEATERKMQKSMLSQNATNSCRPAEDELHESDFWLLENIL